MAWRGSMPSYLSRPAPITSTRVESTGRFASFRRDIHLVGDPRKVPVQHKPETVKHFDANMNYDSLFVVDSAFDMTENTPIKPANEETELNTRNTRKSVSSSTIPTDCVTPF